ncbi:MAG TPA: SCO family protein [Rhizomicrobium sp.]|nr:SCO family protein [Rhizomicrobium sp.]
MTDIKGIMPSLQFMLHRANDDAPVTERSYRGEIAVLYFGYTHCPDVCPTTLSNLSVALNAMGDEAKKVRVLFVSVDPNRDTIPVLKAYVNAFAPEVDGLRGTPNQVADLARRYRVAFSVTPETPGQPYEVTHSNGVYFFDGKGKARFVTMDTTNKDALVQTIRYLIDSAGD